MMIDHPIKSHQNTVNLAESARQTAVAAAIAAGGNSVQKNIAAAEATFYRAVIASCVANGLPYSDFRQGLHDVAGVWV